MSTTALSEIPTPSFGEFLRQWRARRRLSQLDLALEASISAKHLSFLESGRARPSREMVLILADALALQPREQNHLLRAAGFADEYQHTDLFAADLESVRSALELMLAQHRWPVIAIDRGWRVLLANTIAHRTVLQFLARPGRSEVAGANVLDPIFDPERGGRYIVNRSELATATIERLYREVAANGSDSPAQPLLDALLARPDACASWRRPNLLDPTSPVVPMVLRKQERCVHMMTCIGTLGARLDLTGEEIRIVTFFPADDLSARMFGTGGCP